MICPDLPTQVNGTVTYSDSTIPRAKGSTVNYSCDTGYGLTGDAVLMCTSSGWNGNVPYCTGV